MWVSDAVQTQSAHSCWQRDSEIPLFIYFHTRKSVAGPVQTPIRNLILSPSLSLSLLTLPPYPSLPLPLPLPLPLHLPPCSPSFSLFRSLSLSFSLHTASNQLQLWKHERGWTKAEANFWEVATGLPRRRFYPILTQAGTKPGSKFLRAEKLRCCYKRTQTDANLGSFGSGSWDLPPQRVGRVGPGAPQELRLFKATRVPAGPQQESSCRQAQDIQSIEDFFSSRGPSLAWGFILVKAKNAARPMSVGNRIAHISALTGWETLSSSLVPNFIRDMNTHSNSWLPPTG